DVDCGKDCRLPIQAKRKCEIAGRRERFLRTFALGSISGCPMSRPLEIARWWSKARKPGLPYARLVISIRSDILGLLRIAISRGEAKSGRVSGRMRNNKQNTNERLRYRSISAFRLVPSAEIGRSLAGKNISLSILGRPVSGDKFTDSAEP